MIDRTTGQMKRERERKEEIYNVSQAREATKRGEQSHMALDFRRIWRCAKERAPHPSLLSRLFTTTQQQSNPISQSVKQSAHSEPSTAAQTVIFVFVGLGRAFGFVEDAEDRQHQETTVNAGGSVQMNDGRRARGLHAAAERLLSGRAAQPHEEGGAGSDLRLINFDHFRARVNDARHHTQECDTEDTEDAVDRSDRRFDGQRNSRQETREGDKQEVSGIVTAIKLRGSTTVPAAPAARFEIHRSEGSKPKESHASAKGAVNKGGVRAHVELGRVGPHPQSAPIDADWRKKGVSRDPNCIEGQILTRHFQAKNESV
jgi:hypothetical protein